MNLFDISTLTKQVVAGDQRAIARAITIAENRSADLGVLLQGLSPQTGGARVVGVTGAPGSGKSTLVDQLIEHYLAQDARVAVLAIDPSSPFSGGAVLGDRIRMQSLLQNEAVYMRSMATRGALGGLALATFDAVQILDAAGFDLILVETVGVGQAEVDIARLADTTLVVLVPGMGDGVQALKAGVLEIADLFVLNKADHAGIELLERDLIALLRLVDHASEDWIPPIARTVATAGEGLEKLGLEIDRHHEWLKQSPAGAERRRALTRTRLEALLAVELHQLVGLVGQEAFDQLVDRYLEGDTTLYGVVRDGLEVIRKSWCEKNS